METFFLALRNLTRQKKRSFLLAGAIAFGFFIVTLVDGMSIGAIDNMSKLFDNVYGGNVFVAASERIENDKVVNITRDEKLVLDVVESTKYNFIDKNKRTLHGGTFIFEGEKAITNIFGCDFEAEKTLVDSINFVSGSFDNFPENGLILCESTSESLNVQVGDTVLFSTETVTGQATFSEFIVSGIMKDLSMLSTIVSYVNIGYLNELIGLEKDAFSEYQFMLKNRREQDKASNAIEDAIRAKGLQVTDRRKAVMEQKDDPWGAISEQINDDKTWKGTLYTVSCMNDQMGFIDTFTLVVQAISTGVLLAIMLIVMVGISNTYKMIMFERIREIGTMRALGMTKNQTAAIFRWEAVLLSILGAIIGLALAIIVMSILTIPTFKSVNLEIVLLNGHIAWRLIPISIFIKFFVMIALTLLAVNGSATEAAKMKPADALRTVK